MLIGSAFSRGRALIHITFITFPDSFTTGIQWLLKFLDSKAYNSTENLWKERPSVDYDSDTNRGSRGGGTSSRESEGHKLTAGNKVFSSALQSVRADQDRQEIQRKNRTFNFGNSAMDAVTSEATDNSEEKRNKDKLRKLSEQYRGKFPRIEGIHNTKEKAVAVLHFSAGKIQLYGLPHIFIANSSESLLVIF